MSSLLGSSQTTNSSNTGATSGSTNLSASSTPTFSPDLQALMSSLLNYSGSSMSNPSAMFKPVENAGLQSINQTYASAPGQVAKQMASRGYGSSGAMGDAMFKTGLARAGAVSNFEGGLATDAINQQNFGANLGTQLLNAGKGTSSTSSGTTSGTSSSNGTSTQTSNPGIGGILGSLASMLMMGATGGVSGLFSGGGGGNSDFGIGEDPGSAN